MKFKGEDIKKVSIKVEEDRITFNDSLSVTMDEFEAITSLITNQIKIQTVNIITQFFKNNKNDETKKDRNKEVIFDLNMEKSTSIWGNINE